MQSFLKYFGPFSPLPPLPKKSGHVFIWKGALWHFYLSLHLLIALAAPGVHFQDALREAGLLAATLQLTASGKWQVLIDVLWALYFLYLSLWKKKKMCDRFHILLGPIDFNVSYSSFIGTCMFVGNWWYSRHLFVSVWHQTPISLWTPFWTGNSQQPPYRFSSDQQVIQRTS